LVWGYSLAVAVEQAERYASEKGVLLVQAAGNDGGDIDTAAISPGFMDGTKAFKRHYGRSEAPGTNAVASFSFMGRNGGRICTR